MDLHPYRPTYKSRSPSLSGSPNDPIVASPPTPSPTSLFSFRNFPFSLINKYEFLPSARLQRIGRGRRRYPHLNRYSAWVAFVLQSRFLWNDFERQASVLR